MSDKEKAEVLLRAVQDIHSILASMTTLGEMPVSQAIHVFENTFVAVATICLKAQEMVAPN